MRTDDLLESFRKPPQLNFTSAELWGLIFFDVYLSEGILARLKWKRWFLGVIGPRCTTAASLLQALTYIFLVGSSITRQRPGFQKSDSAPASSQRETADGMRQRVEGAGKEAQHFSGLYPDLLANVSLAANLRSATVQNALQSERGQQLLLGTKVPVSAAFDLATQKVEEGFMFGRVYPNLAQSLVQNSQPETLSDFDREALELLQEWETRATSTKPPGTIERE